MNTSEKNRRHTVAAVIGLTAICIIGTVGWLAVQLTVTRERALQFASQAAVHLGVVSGDYIEEAIMTADLVLRQLVEQARVDHMRALDTLIDRALDTLIDNEIAGPWREGLMVVDHSGMVRTAKGAGDLVVPDLFARHRDSPDLQMAITAKNIGGRSLLILSRRLEAASGSFRGMVAMAIRLDRFDKILKGGETMSQAALYLPSGERLTPVPPGFQPDTGRFAYQRSLPATDLIVASFVVEHEALKWWRADASFMVPVVLLFAVILALAAAAQVATVNRGYRQQVDRLNAVTGANAELESVVAERTMALNIARNNAERASNAKSSFLAAAAHDLRQPLQALMMFLDELAYRPLGTEEQVILGKVEAAAQALSNLLNGLLDIGAIDSGMTEAHFADVRLGAIIDGIEAKFLAPAEAKGLTLTIVSTNAAARTDPVLLTRILSNLVANAVRYTESGRILVGCRRRGGEILVQVMDTGIGIAPEQVPLIFEEYYQVANAGRNRRHGTGLGLAIVERLSALLGHVTEVRSKPGRGSGVTVRLPRAAGHLPDDSENRSEPVINGQGALILVIEDDPEVRQSIDRSLKNRRYAVLSVGSGPEALGLARWVGRPPAAIVADYRLADGETGIEVISALRALDPQGKTPAILLTGEQRIDGELPKDVMLMRKPITPAALCAAIERLRASA